MRVISTVPECTSANTPSPCYPSTPNTAPTTATKLLDSSNAFSWVVGNWWDTILIPPHGYVKVKYWINVPQQADDASSVTVNANRQGIWVYHCHILRHEDRGMMMPIITLPLSTQQERRLPDTSGTP